jgi:hypothetical protein
MQHLLEIHKVNFSVLYVIMMRQNSVVVWQMATGWMAEGPESKYRQDFSPLHVIQTDSGVHQASYPVGTGYKVVGM